MNAIFNVVSMEEFKRISNVEVAHIAWNILQTVKEGMLCGKDVYGVYHFVLILKSHVIWLSNLNLLRKA